MKTEPAAALLRHRGEVVLAGAVFSLGGVLIRMVETAGAWQILFYRSLALALGVAAVIAWRHRGGLFLYLAAAGGAGLVGGLCIGVAMTSFVWAITQTTVATVLFMIAAAPFFAALIGRFTIGEVIGPRTWAMMALAALGIGIMVYEGLAIGHAGGLIAGLCASIGLAAFTVVVRWRQSVDLILAVLFAAVFSLIIGMAGSWPVGLAVSPADLGWCLLYGGPVMLLGFGLFTHGGRFIPAAEVALLSMSEVALGPIWVWLVLNETVTRATLIGGALILTAVMVMFRRPDRG